MGLPNLNSFGIKLLDQLQQSPETVDDSAADVSVMRTITIIVIAMMIVCIVYLTHDSYESSTLHG